MRNYWFAFLAIMIVFAGCKKNSDEVDARDPFVGTYAYETDGEMAFDQTIPGQGAATLPLESTGTFNITKLGDKDSVLISGAFDGKIPPFKAIVNGNQLTLVEKEYSAKGAIFTATMTIANTTVNMVDEALSWETDATCVATITLLGASTTITGNGNVTMTATKK